MQVINEKFALEGEMDVEEVIRIKIRIKFND